MKLNFLLFLLFCFFLNFPNAFAQKSKSAADVALAYTPAILRLKNNEKLKFLNENSLVKNVSFKSIGPTIMSGRVVDVDVDPIDATHFYVAYASGGLWFTNNNGQSFTPVFDNENVITIGDFAVDWKNNMIYVGTGECNSSRSSYSGVGVFKTSDGGKSWSNIGLEETHHIGRVVICNKNPEVIWVAAIGHLYSSNKERGIFRSTDGGKTWTQTLFIDENTGCIDLVQDLKNPDILYASAWQRERRAWNFTESGSKSGIYKSIDGGKTWTLLTNQNSGFPVGEGVGRIGLTLSKTGIYAILDNQASRPSKKKEEKPSLNIDSLSKMTKEQFLKTDDELINDILDKYDFPEKYHSKSIKELVKQDKIKPLALLDYIENADNNLFNTEVIGAEVYFSKDGGATWKRTHEKYINNLVYTYGYYFGLIQVSPFDDNEIYIAGVPVLKSTDGGKTFRSIDGDNVHGDFHSIWIDPSRKGHMIIGEDGGLVITYDGGKTYTNCNSPAVGQFYSVNFDYATPYNVYGGLQDNGVWTGPSDYRYSPYWQSSGNYPYKSIMGGDGMQVEIDKRDNSTVYTGYQFGNYYRLNKNTGDEKYITPQIDLGEKPLRWNWQSPIKLSAFNNDIVYFGSNKLYRSFDKGETWQCISPDLTNGGRKGDVPYGTITAIDESKLKFGLLYAGTDDGNIHLTKDGGNTWTKITDKLPQNIWCSRLSASIYKESRVYASLNGYCWDDMNAYVFSSDDYGKTWFKIGTDLPFEPVNVIKEDPKNENIIYIGTDNGLYISINRGKSFMTFNIGLPRVAVHDLVIHPRDNEIITGTHGRSIYIADVSLIQQLTDSLITKDVYAFKMKDKRFSSRWGNKSAEWMEFDTTSVKIPFYTNSNQVLDIKVKSEDLILADFKYKADKGLNFFNYDLSINEKMLEEYKNQLNKDNKEGEEKIEVKKADNEKYYLQPGKYIIDLISASGITSSTKFEIKAPEKRSRNSNKISRETD